MWIYLQRKGSSFTHSFSTFSRHLYYSTMFVRNWVFVAGIHRWYKWYGVWYDESASLFGIDEYGFKGKSVDKIGYIRKAWVSCVLFP